MRNQRGGTRLAVETISQGTHTVALKFSVVLTKFVNTAHEGAQRTYSKVLHIISGRHFTDESIANLDKGTKHLHWRCLRSKYGLGPRLPDKSTMRKLSTRCSSWAYSILVENMTELVGWALERLVGIFLHNEKLLLYLQALKVRR